MKAYLNGVTVMNSESFIQSELAKNELNQLKMQVENLKEQKYSELLRENKQLKDNWDKLKEIAQSQSNFKLKCKNKKLWFEVDELLDKMQELEQGGKNGG